MESSAESCCIPPGFRFHPTEEELVGYYLKKKVASQEIDLDVIKDIDLYRIEPWDLQERCRIGYEEQREWYFFSHKDKKYPTGRRTNRATMTGFWKATGRDKAVYDKAGLIGMRKTLVFYVGRAPNGRKTDWIMHEYRLESEDNGPPQEEGWVVCRAFMKRPNSQYKSTDDRWDANLYYQKQSHMDSVTHTSKMPQTLLCKQEDELTDNHLNHLHSDPYVELPQLERPSPPLMKNSNLVPISSENKVKETSLTNKLCVEKVTDWRALDKLVASQLSQEDDGYDISERNPACMSLEQNSDVGLLLWQTSIEEESAVKKGFLSSVCDCDIGICIFGS